jgi:hypothetical protein
MFGAAVFFAGWLLACAQRDSLAETMIAAALVFYGAWLTEARRQRS